MLAEYKAAWLIVLGFLAFGWLPQVVLAADVDGDCAAGYREGFATIIGQVSATPPRARRPAKGKIRFDPDFHVCVIRATDHGSEPVHGFARNDYSRRQAFNADNSRFIVYASGGAWHLYDADSLTYLRQLNGPQGDAEPQWDAVDPRILYYLPTRGGMSLLKLDVESNLSTVAADFTGRLPWPKAARVWTRSEGSPSTNGRYWCFLAETEGFGSLGVFTYDLVEQKVVGSRALQVQPDHVSMSPSGRWCVIASDPKSGGTVAWNSSFTYSRTLHSDSAHSDLAIGADGDDYYVFVDQAESGYLIMVDLETGVRTDLLPTWIAGTTTSLHVSGKAFSRPGWVLLSTFNHHGPEQWLHERVIAVEMKANPKIINLAHHHARYNGYWTQPQASVSRDFTRALFNSNWDSTSDTDVDAYMIRMPDDLFGTARARSDNSR